ncbi:hypothetical protein BDZ91DRAFT_372556 [Kalaharituber pfeilii]|nr:hypothetical protein BDZ91DRAFT_372556 [Kalaharituber pfeilii]
MKSMSTYILLSRTRGKPSWSIPLIQGLYGGCMISNCYLQRSGWNGDARNVNLLFYEYVMLFLYFIYSRGCRRTTGGDYHKVVEKNTPAELGRCREAPLFTLLKFISLCYELSPHN